MISSCSLISPELWRGLILPVLLCRGLNSVGTSLLYPGTVRPPLSAAMLCKRSPPTEFYPNIIVSCETPDAFTSIECPLCIISGVKRPLPKWYGCFVSYFLGGTKYFCTGSMNVPKRSVVSITRVSVVDTANS